MKPLILVAGIGNIFKGDDGFGVEVANRLAMKSGNEAVQIVDFGIRGLDLAYALMDGDYRLVILVDAVQRGGPPGTVYLITPELTDNGWEMGVGTQTHGMDPARVLAWVRAMGEKLTEIRIVGCEPAELGDDEELKLGLSTVVAEAVEPAVLTIERLIEETAASQRFAGKETLC